MAYSDIAPLDWVGQHYAQRGLPVIEFSGRPGLSNPLSFGEWFRKTVGKEATTNDEGEVGYIDDETGGFRRASESHREGYQDYLYNKSRFDAGDIPDYETAKNTYGQGYIPWNWQDVRQGLSTRQPYNLNALYGGSQYQANRVTDWSHLDSTQYDATRLAANTRNQLWNIHNNLLSKGIQPAMNPDIAALEIYQKYVGGSPFGYGANSNPLLIREAVFNSYLNQPEVAQARGTGYQTPQENIPIIQEYQKARDAGVPTFQTFERQGQSSDMFGNLLLGATLAAISGGMAGPLAGALGGGTLGTLGSGALIGGGLSALTGGDPLKGAILGGTGAGLNLALPEISSAVSNALQVSPETANIIASNLSRAGLTGVATGDIEQAIQSAATGAALSGVAQSEPVSETAASIRDTLVSSGMDAETATKVASNLIRTVGATALTGIAGGDITPGLAKGLMKIAGNVVSGLDTGTPHQDAEAQEGGFYGIPSGYEGLGYTPQEISDLIAGTYTEPITSPTSNEPLPEDTEGGLPVETPVEAPTEPQEPSAGQDTTRPTVGTEEGSTPSLDSIIDKIPFAGILGGVTGTSGKAKRAATPQAAAEQAQSGLSNIPWLDTSAEVLKNVIPGTTGANLVSGLSLASGGTTSCCSSLYSICKYAPKFACSQSEMLQTAVSPKRLPATLQKLKHLQSSISPLGNMGGLAKGGLPKKYQEASPDGHNPEFVTGLTGFYADGAGTGQSDDIPALLHDGDYVMDAETVSALGDGSSKAGRQVLDGFREKIPHSAATGGRVVPAKIADGEYVFPASFVTALGGGDNKQGAKILDGLREKLRAHKRSAPTDKIPPKAKSPLDYIAKR